MRRARRGAHRHRGGGSCRVEGAGCIAGGNSTRTVARLRGSRQRVPARRQRLTQPVAGSDLLALISGAPSGEPTASSWPCPLKNVTEVPLETRSAAGEHPSWSGGCGAFCFPTFAGSVCHECRSLRQEPDPDQPDGIVWSGAIVRTPPSIAPLPELILGIVSVGRIPGDRRILSCRSGAGFGAASNLQEKGDQASALVSARSLCDVDFQLGGLGGNC